VICVGMSGDKDRESGKHRSGSYTVIYINKAGGTGGVGVVIYLYTSQVVRYCVYKVVLRWV